MADRITSVQNQRVKDAVRLRDRRGRDEQQRIVIDGIREISRALDAGVKVLEIFAELAGLSEREQEVIAHAERSGVQIVDVAPAVMSKLAYGDRESGLVAVARPPRKSFAELHLSSDALVAVLEQIEKPGNLGAVVRSADAAGVSAVIIADAKTDIFNPNAIRASAGTIFSMPVIGASVEETLQWLRTGGFRIYASRVDASAQFWDVPFDGRVALVFGNEVSGLSSKWKHSDAQPIRVPQKGLADSLNVSVTAALLFYEALRQRERSVTAQQGH
jgi:TrmH family RNA methyltransferase